MKQSLLGMTPDELKRVVTEAGLKPFVAKQIAHWLYVKGVATIDEMSNLPKTARELLNKNYEVGRQQPISAVTSVDGTRKYLFATTHGTVETVYIPEDDRHTLCVSSQVGCKMNCQFCMTGKQGWSGHLTATEILNQIYSVDESKLLTNIVFMGMGEPFDNTDNVLRTIEAMTADWGAAWSPKRITVSTVGIVPGMVRFLKESKCHLAISLHNPIATERGEIMPIQKAFPLERILSAVKEFDFAHQRRLSFEYIVFEGINDTQRHATQLVQLLKRLPCRVNLIRWHAIPGMDMHSPSEIKMVQFRDYLNNNGITCTIRRSRGEDIAAACGLLKSENEA
ncbi:MAG: 23S rRNA (adenine(2503)-C(2))-methyltransferase RlmN [Bacteroidales bacterium]|nr:23S rRNA (adenine(2503)-C(2))-methyltransferase RlmN [Bacteroidales bacterium]